MNIKKSLLVLGAVTGIGLAGVTGIGVASAATNNSGTDSIIDRISTKFNLNKDEVKVVFEEERAAREIEKQQKAKILAKLEELKDRRETWKDKSPEERKAAKQELRGDIEQWAEGNNIPAEYLMLKMHKFGPHTPGMHKVLE